MHLHCAEIIYLFFLLSLAIILRKQRRPSPTQLLEHRCIRGEAAPTDELLDPPIGQDTDSEPLRFAEGDAGTRQILEYLREQTDDDAEDEEVPA
jgi:hypothetical protein